MVNLSWIVKKMLYHCTLTYICHPWNPLQMSRKQVDMRVDNFPALNEEVEERKIGQKVHSKDLRSFFISIWKDWEYSNLDRPTDAPLT